MKQINVSFKAINKFESFLSSSFSSQAPSYCWFMTIVKERIYALNCIFKCINLVFQMPKKSWTEKLNDSKDFPRVEPINEKLNKRWGNGTVVIPTPLEVYDLMSKIPEGKVITIKEMPSNKQPRARYKRMTARITKSFETCSSPMSMVSCLGRPISPTELARIIAPKTTNSSITKV